MNTTITSKEAILETSRRIIREEGLARLSIRSVAAACGVSVGSIYNYFESKSELAAAAIERVWEDIFHFPKQEEFLHFSDCVRWIFDSIQSGSEKYPGFFTLHSVGFFGEEKTTGRERMENSWHHIQKELLCVLNRDPDVRPEVFQGALTRESLVDMIFSLILSALVQQKYDSGPVLEMLRQLLYG